MGRPFLVLLLLAAWWLGAPPEAVAQRAGGENSLDVETLDGGGGVSQAGSVLVHGSFGGPLGVSSATTPVPESEALNLFGGFLGQISVLSIYLADEIDDAWQEAFFGPENPAGLPDQDPDGDGINNHLEFVAGTDPTDPSSTFTVATAPDPAQPDRVTIFFYPFLEDRTYTLLVSATLLDGSFVEHPAVASGTPGGFGSFVILNAPGALFYRIHIEMN